MVCTNHGIGKFITPGDRHWKELHQWLFRLGILKASIEGPVGDVVPGVGCEMRQRIYESMWRLQPFYQREPFCLLHGDPHPGKCLSNGQ